MPAASKTFWTTTSGYDMPVTFSMMAPSTV